MVTESTAVRPLVGELELTIGGVRETGAGAPLHVFNPATEELIVSVPGADEAQNRARHPCRSRRL